MQSLSAEEETPETPAPGAASSSSARPTLPPSSSMRSVSCSDSELE